MGDRSSDVEQREMRLAHAVQQIRTIQPQGPTFLDRIDNDQFWWGLCYGELVRQGFTGLHILPDAAAHGVAVPPREWCVDPNFQQGPGQVYDVSSVPPHIESRQGSLPKN